MMKESLLLAIGLCSASILHAGDPQIVFEQSDGNFHVEKVKDISHLSFTPAGLEIYNAAGDNDKIFSYQELEKVLIDAEGAVPSGVMSVEAKSSPLRVTPSPAEDRITVLGTGDDPVDIDIYSTDGSRVMSVPAYTYGIIDVSSFSAGVYIVNAGGNSTKFFKK